MFGASKFRKVGNASTSFDKLKIIGGIAAGLGADFAIGALLSQNLSLAGYKTATKILAKIGIWFIAFKVGDDIDEYFCRVVDEFAASYSEMKTDFKEAFQSNK